MALFLLGCLVLTIIGLRWYTHHGQSLILPNYVGEKLVEARENAERASFELRIIDSTFVVGKEGGIILDQNPKAGSKVKQKRKIYLTVSKSQADEIPFRRLPILYGKSYARKQKELEQGYQIKSKVIGRKYDAGAPDHILEVIYRGRTIVDEKQRKEDVMIEKGGTLEMILSKSSGGSLTMPDLTCKMYTEVAFHLQTLNLMMGENHQDDTVEDQNEAYVWKQVPSAGARVYTGDTVQVFLTQVRPADCIDL
ncbi:MAG: PASTA domain-containing protein [Saprospiraceae bacterium]|nr:PASTA domain-containing protein [Saprospiraceae bacterium]